MTLVNGIRLWFIVIWSLSIVFSLAEIIQYRTRRHVVEQQAGPVPTPMGIFQIVFLLILLARVGEISAGSSGGGLIVRLLGVGLSLYSLGMLLWTGRTLGRFGAPGPAVFRDHELIIAGPFRLARHPGYSAIQAITLGTALGTLNWLMLALWPLVVASTYLTSRAEEELLQEKFGTEYAEYARQTNRFIFGIW